MSELADRLDGAHNRLREQIPSPSYLTIEEVAELGRVSHKTVRRAISSGALQAFKPGLRWVIREADAVDWIEAHPAVAAVPRARRPRASRPAAGSVSRLRELERAHTDQ